MSLPISEGDVGTRPTDDAFDPSSVRKIGRIFEGDRCQALTEDAAAILASRAPREERIAAWLGSV